MSLVAMSVGVLATPPDIGAQWSLVAESFAISGALLIIVAVGVSASETKLPRHTAVLVGVAVAFVLLAGRLGSSEVLTADRRVVDLSAEGRGALTVMWRISIPAFAIAGLMGASRRLLIGTGVAAAAGSSILVVASDTLPSWLADVQTDSNIRWGLAIPLLLLWSGATWSWVRETGRKPLACDAWIGAMLLLGSVNQLIWIGADRQAANGWDSAALVAPVLVIPALGLLGSCAIFTVRLRDYEGHLGTAYVELEQQVAAHRPGQTVAVSISREAVLRVLEAPTIPMLHQPVVDLRTGRIIGHEALARIPDLPTRPPDQWFAAARAHGLGVDLELLAIDSALREVALHRNLGDLAVNVSPATLASPQFRKLLDTHPIDALIIEVTEQDAISDYGLIREALQQHARRGLRLAVDDVGSGQGGLRHLVGLRPAILKIDMSLTKEMSTDPSVAALVTALTSFAHAIGAEVVAEGIESASDLEAVIAADVHLGQGYLLARPMPIASLAALVASGTLLPSAHHRTP